MKVTLKNTALSLLFSLTILAGVQAGAVQSHWKDLTQLEFPGAYPTEQASQRLYDELDFQRAVQVYLWALPAMNIDAMRQGSEAAFGAGNHILPVWKDRLNTKTKVTTPNSDVVYAMSYLDLKAGPVVVEVPPKLQGMFDDFWHRPICDVGFVGPDKGKGGKYLLLPPDYRGEKPDGYFSFRSSTYRVFLFWRGFLVDGKTDEAVNIIEKTTIYPLGKKNNAPAMIFPNASQKPANMLVTQDISYFENLKKFIDYEPVNREDFAMRGMMATLGIRLMPTDRDERMKLLEKVAIYPYTERKNPKPRGFITPNGKPWLAAQPRGMTYWKRLADVINKEPVFERDRFFMAMLKPLGIEKGKPFQPNWRQERILIEAALVGEAMAKANDFAKRMDDAHYVDGSHWEFATVSPPDQRREHFDALDGRAAWFYEAVTNDPAMHGQKTGKGQVYLAAYKDKDGDWLDGGTNYVLNVPVDAPAEAFWSITLYDVDTRCIIRNEQKIADRSSRMDLSVNKDGSVTIYIGPAKPEGRKQRNWIPTVPGKAWFPYFRLYSPKKAFLDRSWVLPDIGPNDYRPMNNNNKQPSIYPRPGNLKLYDRFKEKCLLSGARPDGSQMTGYVFQLLI